MCVCVCLCVCVCIYLTPPPRTGCKTRSIYKRTITSKVSVQKSCQDEVQVSSLSFNLRVSIDLCITFFDIRGARGVMVIVVRNRHGDSSSNSEQGCLHLHRTNTIWKNTYPTILLLAMSK